MRVCFSVGPVVELTGDEVADAIAAYVAARGVNITGPRTVVVNAQLCKSGAINVDPSGFVTIDNIAIEGGI